MVKFKLHQGQIHGFFALCMMFRSLQFAPAHSLRFASPRISLAVCTQPYNDNSRWKGRLTDAIIDQIQGYYGKDIRPHIGNRDGMCKVIWQYIIMLSKIQICLW